MRDPPLFIARGGKCPLIAIETFRCLLSVPSHKCSSFDLFIFSAFNGHIKASLLIKVIVFFNYDADLEINEAAMLQSLEVLLPDL